MNKTPCDCPKGGMDIDGRVCQKCDGTEFITPHNTKTVDWRDEFRPYFDKYLKPKKETIKNVDRELLVDFITKIEKEAYERGRKEEREKILERIEGKRRLARRCAAEDRKFDAQCHSCENGLSDCDYQNVQLSYNNALDDLQATLREETK